MYAPAFPHDEIVEIYPTVYLLHGSIKMGPGLKLNRNMVILKDGEQLTLINPVRMNDSGMKALDNMGKVKNIIRLGDFHGLDDPYYLNLYDCDFWCQSGQATYPCHHQTVKINKNTNGPVSNSEFFIFKTSKYPEAALLLKKYKLLITTDAIQYYTDWSYTSFITKIVFKILGFKMGLNIGKPWLKRVTPKGKSLERDFIELLELDFDSLIAAHGTLVRSGVKKQLVNEMKHVFK